MIKAVLFDLDNTLVDFMLLKNNAVEAAVHAMVDAGIDMSVEDARDKINIIYKEQGIEYQTVFDKFLTDNFGEINYKILSSAIVAYRKAREASLKPYPKVVSTLLQLVRSGLKLGVISDAPAKEAWLRLAYLNFTHFFDVVVTYEEKGERKPSRYPFDRAMSVLNVNPSECLMIGDWAERDIVGAKSLGMATVFAKYGDTFNTKEPGSDFVIESISELPRIIEKINSRINA